MTFPVYHNDKTIKIEYDPTLNLTITELNKVGATDSATLRTLDFTPSDTNSVYVAKTGSDTTGDGTAANPYLTIKQALTAVTATKCNVVIADSGTYIEESQAIDTDCARIVAAIGQTPVIQPAAALVGAAADNYYCGEVIDTFLLEAGLISKGAHLSNGETVLVYQNSSYTVCAKFLSSNGTELRDDVELFTYPNTYYGNFSVCALASGHFVVTVNVWDGSTYVNLAVYIFTNAGAQVYYNYFSSIRSYNNAVCALEGYNDRFVVAVSSHSGSFGTHYMIMNNAGDVLTSITQISTDRAHDCSLSVVADEDSGFIVLYRVYSGNAVWYHYNSSGTCIHSAGFIATGAVYPAAVIYDSLILFAVNDSSNNIIFVEYSLSTHLVTKTAATVATLTSSAKPSIIQLTNGVFCVSAGDTPAGLFYTTPAWSLIGSAEYFENIKVSSSGAGLDQKFNIIYDTTNERVFLFYEKLNVVEIYLNIQGGFLMDWWAVTSAILFNGITFDCDNDKVKRYLNISGASVTFKWCTLQNISRDTYNDGNGYTFWSVISTATVNDIENCIIKNCDRGFKFTSDSVTVKNSQCFKVLEGPAVYVDGDGASIIINHCDFIMCNYGVQLENNAGTEVIKNSIFWRSIIYDIYAEAAITFINSTYSGALHNATAGYLVVNANPHYCDDGYILQANLNLRLKSRNIGYQFDSPALLIADDLKNAGALEISTAGSTETWTSITVSKVKVNISYDPVGAVETDYGDGDVDSSVDSFSEILELNWGAIFNADLQKLLTFIFTKASRVRIYLDPDTNPYTYGVYKYIYDKVNASPPLPALSRTGASDVNLKFKRAYNEGD